MTSVPEGTGHRTHARNYILVNLLILQSMSSLEPCDLVSHGNYVIVDSRD
jgi:hypothetical protein